MEEQIKAAAQKSLDELKRMQDRFDEMIDDLPEEAEAIRARTEASLNKIGEKLRESLKQADENTQKAQLQAHLGLMEAHDRLDASRAVLDEYLTQVSQRARSSMDEAELKRHLAMMEAQEFWETRGKHFAAEFERSQQLMMSTATRAVADLQVTLRNWNELFTQRRD